MNPAFQQFRFAVAPVNRALEATHRLPTFGRADNLGILIWTGREQWSPLLAERRADPALAATADPVDRWTERQVGELLAELPARAQARFAHDYPPVPMQRIADLAGLAPLSPGRLNVHPERGPWLALRAVIAVDAPAPPAATRPQLACDCAAGCQPALDRAMAAHAAPDQASVAEHWRLWLAVRDACPVGRDHRYSDQQIRYHYIKNPAILDE